MKKVNKKVDIGEFLTMHALLASVYIAIYTKLMFNPILGDEKRVISLALLIVLTFGICMSMVVFEWGILGWKRPLCCHLNILIALTVYSLLSFRSAESSQITLSEMKEETPSITLSMDNQDTYEENISKLTKLFDFSRWENCSYKQRIEMLYPAVFLEEQALGLDPNIRIIAADLGEDVRGSYSHAEHTIRLNYSTLDLAPFQALETTLHEVRHAFQHAVVDLYNSLSPEEQRLQIFNTVMPFKYELEHYIDGENLSEDELYLYYNQMVEIDSRSYAHKQVAYYYDQAYYMRYKCEPTYSYPYYVETGDVE